MGEPYGGMRGEWDNKSREISCGGGGGGGTALQTASLPLDVT